MKRICFGTLFNILTQAEASGVTNTKLCEALLSAFGGSSYFDSSLPAHLKSGHDNVPPDVIAASKITAEATVYANFQNNILPLIRENKKKSIVRALKFVLAEDNNIGDDMVVGYIKGYEKSNILSCTTFSFHELLANVFYYAIKDVSNHDCMDAIKEIGKDYLAAFDTAADEVYFQTQMSEKLVPLKKTIKTENFAHTFIKAADGIITGLSNPSSVEFYSVDVNNFEFKFKELKTYLVDNIGNYVFSRAKIASYESDGKGDTVAFRAAMLLSNRYKTGDKWADSILGEILLYLFLEQGLDAPKIVSKIEIRPDSSGIVSKCDGVHLLTSTDTGLPYNQLVFGASDIVGDLKAAIDRVFEKVFQIRSNSDNELQMVENTIYDNLYDQPTTKFLSNVINPHDSGVAKPDMAFGAFLGYTLGQGHEGMSCTEFKTAVLNKIKADIEDVKPYICQKIRDLKLEGYSFFFYVLPFNEAPEEKNSIMSGLFEPGV